MFHSEIPAKWTVTKYKRNLLFIKVAFLLVNLNTDFAIKTSFFCSIKDQTNLRLQSERSTSERGSFRLLCQSGFISLFQLLKLLLDRKKRGRSSVNTACQGSFRQKLFTFTRCSMPLKDCSIFNSSSTVTLNPLGRENA